MNQSPSARTVAYIPIYYVRRLCILSPKPHRIDSYGRKESIWTQRSVHFSQNCQEQQECRYRYAIQIWYAEFMKGAGETTQQCLLPLSEISIGTSASSVLPKRGGKSECINYQSISNKVKWGWLRHGFTPPPPEKKTSTKGWLHQWHPRGIFL